MLDPNSKHISAYSLDYFDSVACHRVPPPLYSTLKAAAICSFQERQSALKPDSLCSLKSAHFATSFYFSGSIAFSGAAATGSGDPLTASHPPSHQTSCASSAADLSHSCSCRSSCQPRR